MSGPSLPESLVKQMMGVSNPWLREVALAFIRLNLRCYAHCRQVVDMNIRQMNQVCQTLLRASSCSSGCRINNVVAQEAEPR